MRAAKVDRNHPEIVKALRHAGATVQSLAMVGNGVPDLLVGFRGQTFLMEIKDPLRYPSEQKLNEEQVKWHASWTGKPPEVVKTIHDALRVIGLE